MITLLQRVTQTSVIIASKVHSKIDNGLLILVGIENEDTEEDINWLSKKIVNIRIFDDSSGIMNCSVNDVGGELMVVSQFTLHASTKKGNRPSYVKAAKPEIALPLYDLFVSKLQLLTTKKVQTGVFGENMQIKLTNNGPITLILNSKNKQ